MLDDLLRAYRAAGTTLIGLEAAVQDPAYARNPDLVWDGERTFLRQLVESDNIEIPLLKTPGRRSRASVPLGPWHCRLATGS
jgi:hypothetical protein